MKQKRKNSQLSELSQDPQEQTSTKIGVAREIKSKNSGKETDCSSGVCTVVWKPESLKR